MMHRFNKVEEALEELKNGRIIMVTDNPDREDEGDFVCAAQFATTDNINFMATYGKGLICMPMSGEYVRRLNFPRWWTGIRTTTRRPLRSRLTVWPRRPGFPPPNAP